MECLKTPYVNVFEDIQICMCTNLRFILKKKQHNINKMILQTG